MMHVIWPLLVCLTACAVVAATPVFALGGKDQSRLPLDLPAPVAPPEDDNTNYEDEPPLSDLDPSDIPDVRRVELTDDTARRAIDAFIVVRNKYSDRGIENYKTLEEFAKKAPEGKEFENDVKSFGFSSIADWNDTIMNVGFAYSAIAEDSVPEIKMQIDDVKNDTTIATEARQKMISSLEALIPSKNNWVVVEKLNKEPEYAKKLILLSEQE